MRLLLILQFFVINAINFCLSIEYEIDRCISNGFKNFVFSINNNDDLILRASLVTNGNQVESFRGKDSLIEFQNLIINASIHLRDNTSIEHQVLNKIIQCLWTVGAKDIVPIRDLKNEYFLQARANTFSRLLFGTAGSVQRQLIKLPIKFRNSTISLALDVQIRLAGSLNTLERDMTEVELFSLLYCYYSDQIIFKKQTGSFHVDAHPGNILFENFEHEIFFVWADFGATSSRSDMGNQFRNSLCSFHNTVFTKASKYLPVQNILGEIRRMSSEYDKSYIMELGNMDSILRVISTGVLSRFKGDEEGLQSALKKMSPSLGFGFDYLVAENKRQDIQLKHQDIQLKQQDIELKQLDSKVKQQDIQLNQQDIQLKQLDSKMKEQDIKLKRQGNEITELKNQLQTLISVLNNINNPTPILPASLINANNNTPEIQELVGAGDDDL